MSELRLRVKLGDSEFEAEGASAEVVARFDAWKDLLGNGHRAKPVAAPAAPAEHRAAPVVITDGATDPVEAFAAAVDVTVYQVTGACSPSTATPYLHLDQHCWEALKKNTPIKGPGSVSPTTLAATLLVLWMERLGPTKPTVENVDAVLNTIDLEDRNAVRAVKNCQWLQYRDGTILFNPAQRSRAIAIAKAYCTKQPPEKPA